MRIDLHGASLIEATSIVLSALLSLDMDRYEETLEIITGKGQGSLLVTTLNILDEENRKYKVFDNKIIVYKNDKDEDEFNLEEMFDEIKNHD